MKTKVFVMAAMLLAGVSAFAQEAECCKEACQDTKTTLSNKFLDNWFVGAGVGSSFVVDGVLSGNTQIAAGLIGNFNFGKWIDPSWGIRTGIVGLNAAWRYEGHNYPYHFSFIHGDVMWNVQNQFWGYKPRKVQFIPYLTAGLYLPASNSARSKNFAVGGGLLTKVALTSRLDLDIDLSGIALRQHSVQPANKYGLAGVAFATVGVSYKLGKHTFTTKAEAIAPYCAKVKTAKAETAAAKEDLAAAQQEIEALKAQPKDELANSILDAYSATSTFVADKWDLVNHEKIVLLSAANIIKACPDHKFVVSGYADAKTGYPAYNLKLSEKRAKAVASYLVNELGVNPDQLVIEACGGVGNMYFDEYRLSRCVVIKAQK